MRPSPRIRRLKSDYRSICQLSDESSIFSFECKGDPPQKYELTFKGLGFVRDPKTGEVTTRDEHKVIVELGASYPRMMPGLAWQTPIYHPNISNNGVVCLGGYGTHWVPSLTLSEMATMLWDMIRYENFDSNSPYNRDAALWVKTQSKFSLPIDTRSIRDLLSGETNNNAQPEIDPKDAIRFNNSKKSPWGILSRLVSSGGSGSDEANATAAEDSTETITSEATAQNSVAGTSPETETPEATVVEDDSTPDLSVDDLPAESAATNQDDEILIIDAVIVDEPEPSTPPASTDDSGIVFID